MKWGALILLAAMPCALAGEADDAVALGRSARADGVPQAAIHELKRVAAGTSGPAEVAVLVELARCLLDADRENEAADFLNKTVYREEPAVVFWRAQARAQQRNFQEALRDYDQACAIDFPQRFDAELGRARMLEALGRSREAMDAYQKISPQSPRYRTAQLAAAALLINDHQEKDAGQLLEKIDGGSHAEKDLRRYLEARVSLESEDAERLYREFKPGDPRLAAGVAIGLSDALLRTGAEDRAEENLESFLRENPASPLLGDVLAKLDEVRAHQKDASTNTLKQWEKDDKNAALSAAATFYLARNNERQEQYDRAIRNYAEFLKQYPNDPLHTAATIRLAALLISARQVNAAVAILPANESALNLADQARVRFLHGMAQYLSKDYPSAAKTFINVANLDPKLSEVSLANAALAAINTNDESQAAEILNALRNQNAVVARRIELAEAFQSARAGDPDADERLAWLADRGGTVGDRARLALAESKWLAGERSAAQSEFRRVANSAAAGRSDQKDYFSVYLADDGSIKALDSVSEQAREFLAAHPDSQHEAEVRMKWGEVLMRGGDYRGARFQFEEAARSSDDASMKQSAWFLAARAAIASMNRAELEAAIDTLEKVVDEKTEPLASQARFEQALLQSALGRPKDSVTILDSLSAVGNAPRLRFEARLKKGYVLYSMGADDHAQVDAAIKEWHAIATDPEATAAERNEALTQAAAASQHAGDTDAALADYYAVLTAPRDKEPEYFWYYKAGFEAAQLLETAKRYKEAAAIYEKMAAAPGPRAEEFKERVKRLRLENFIWED